MFLLEILIVLLMGSFTYIICLSASNQPLAILSKLVTAFICIEIVVTAAIPVLQAANQKADELQNKVDTLEKKMGSYEQKINEYDEKVRRYEKKYDNLEKTYEKIINFGIPVKPKK